MSMAILFITLGILFVAAEVFIPSGGILGFIAFALLVTAIVFGFQSGANAGLLTILIELVVVPAVIGFAFWALPRTALGRSIILEPPPASATVAAAEANQVSLLNQQGTTETPHRPSGITNLNDRRVDTLAEGPMIEAGVRVRVVRVEGNNLFVRPVETAEGTKEA